MLRKARAAALRRATPHDQADDLVQEAFLHSEGYECGNAVRSKQTFLVAATVNLSIERER